MFDSGGLLGIVEPLAFAGVGVLVGIASNRFRASRVFALSCIGIGLGVFMDLAPELHAGHVTSMLWRNVEQLIVEIVLPIAAFFILAFVCGRYTGRVIHWVATRWERNRA